MKVSELEGALLNYWVGRALGMPVSVSENSNGELTCYLRDPDFDDRWVFWNPSMNWNMAGSIIERESIEFGRMTDGWGAWIGDLAFDEPMDPTGRGPTHLVAAMRAFVASKFGEEVEDAQPESAG